MENLKLDLIKNDWNFTDTFKSVASKHGFEIIFINKNTASISNGEKTQLVHNYLEVMAFMKMNSTHVKKSTYQVKHLERYAIVSNTSTSGFAPEYYCCVKRPSVKSEFEGAFDYKIITSEIPSEYHLWEKRSDALNVLQNICSILNVTEDKFTVVKVELIIKIS